MQATVGVRPAERQGVTRSGQSLGALIAATIGGRSDRMNLHKSPCASPVGACPNTVWISSGDDMTGFAPIYPLFEILFALPWGIRARAVRRLGLQPGDRVLEAGCGTAGIFHICWPQSAAQATSMASTLPQGCWKGPEGGALGIGGRISLCFCAMRPTVVFLSP